MSNKPRIEDFQKVLVVEGYGDLLFYAEALEYVGQKPAQPGGVFIKEFNGATDLTAKLEAFLDPGKLVTKSSIGVIVDADADARAKSQSVAEVIKKATGRALQHGVWSPRQSNQASLGFFVVPDGQQPGEIETLAWLSWANDPQNGPQRQCIDDYLACMQGQKQVAKSPDKGRISALLAIRNDEDPRLGPGARANVFSFDRPEFQPMLDFLRQL